MLRALCLQKLGCNDIILMKQVMIMDSQIAELDFLVIEKLKKYVLDYIKLNTNSDEYKILYERVNLLKHFIIDFKLKELMLCEGNSIKINPKFIKFDDNGNFLDFNGNIDIIFTQLIHEINHSLSANGDEHGISNLKGAIKYYERENFFLNEGLTQLFAEKVSNITLDKNDQNYHVPLNIARILELSLDAKTLFNSYYFNTENLKVDYNKIAGDGRFELLNKSLNMMDNITDKYSKNEGETIFTKLSNNIYRQIIIDIVIPKLRNLNINARKEYLSKFSKIFTYDKETYNFIVRHIESGLKHVDSLNDYKDKVDNYYKNISNTLKLMSFVKNNENIDRFKILENGEVQFFYNDIDYIIVTDEKLISEIYATKCKETINERELLNSIYATKKIKFPTNDIIDKRCYLEKVRKVLLKNNVILLNSIEEINNIDRLEVKIINSSSVHKVDFKDIYTIIEQYIIVGDKVCNKNTSPKKEIQNIFLKKCAKFSYLFYDIICKINDKRTSHLLFNQIEDSYKKEGRLNYDYILDNNSKTILEGILNSQINFEILNNFFKSNLKNNDKLSYRMSDDCHFYNFIDEQKKKKSVQYK